MKFFLLNWNKVVLLVVFWFVAVVFHNMLSALLGFEEAAFFIIAIFVLPGYFLIALTYTTVKKILKIRNEYVQKRKQK